MLTKKQVCETYDHALLRPYCKREEVDRWCADAIKHGFASVCINPCEVAYAFKTYGDKLSVGTVVGYPQGANTTKVKIAEALDAIDNGASELDLVMNISRFKEGDFDYVLDELKEFMKAVKAKDPKVLVKVIIERFFIDDDEMPKVCDILIQAGVDFIKEATGYAGGTGAEGAENIRLMKRLAGCQIKIKAAHALNSMDDVLLAIENGADRVGGNRLPELLEEAGDAYWLGG